ncbi:hypothetical protein [Streptomyces sp. LARHCF252]
MGYGSVWDADRLRDADRNDVITHLGEADAMVMLTYATAAGQAFIDRRPSLPEQ